MEGLGVIGFIIGLIAFIRVEKLIRVLRSQGTISAKNKD